MPNNKVKTSKQLQGGKRDVHPGSRKAGQLDRINLRTMKLTKAKNIKARANQTKLDRPLFFHYAIPPPPFVAFTLSELHRVLSEVYLTRNDEELEQLRKERRAGRPKSRRENEIEEIKLREQQEYESGFELPDLTNPESVAFLREWEANDTSYLPLCRFIRISSTDPELVVVSKRGLGHGVEKKEDAKPSGSAAEAAEEMEVEA